MSCLFALLMMCYLKQKKLILMKSNITIFSVVAYTFSIMLKKNIV